MPCEAVGGGFYQLPRFIRWLHIENPGISIPLGLKESHLAMQAFVATVQVQTEIGDCEG